MAPREGEGDASDSQLATGVSDDRKTDGPQRAHRSPSQVLLLNSCTDQYRCFQSCACTSIYSIRARCRNDRPAAAVGQPVPHDGALAHGAAVSGVGAVDRSGKKAARKPAGKPTRSKK